MNELIRVIERGYQDLCRGGFHSAVVHLEVAPGAWAAINLFPPDDDRPKTESFINVICNVLASATHCGESKEGVVDILEKALEMHLRSELVSVDSLNERIAQFGVGIGASNDDDCLN